MEPGKVSDILPFDITKFLPCSFIFSNGDYEEQQTHTASKLQEIESMFRNEYKCKEAMNEVFEWLVQIHEMSHLMAFTLATKIVKEIKKRLFFELGKGPKETELFQFWSSTLDQFEKHSTSKTSQLRIIFTQKEPWTIESILQLPQMANSNDLFASVLRTWFYRVHLKWRSGDIEELLTAMYSCQQVIHANSQFFIEDTEKLLLFLFFLVELHEVFIQKLDTENSDEKVNCLKMSTMYMKRIIPLAATVNTNFSSYYIVHTASILQTMSLDATVLLKPQLRLSYLFEGIEYLSVFFKSSTTTFDYILVASAYEIFSDLYRQTASCWELMAMESASVHKSSLKLFKSLQSHIYEAYAFVELIYWKDEIIEKERKVARFPSQIKAYGELKVNYEKERARIIREIFDLLEAIWKKAKESFGKTWAYNKTFYDISSALFCICVRMKERILERKMFKTQLDWCENFLKLAFTEIKVNLDLFFNRLTKQVFLNSESVEEVYVSLSQYMKIYGNLDRYLVKRTPGTYDPSSLKSIMFPELKNRPTLEPEIRCLLSIAHFEYKLAGRFKDAENTLLLTLREYRKWFDENHANETRNFESDYGLFLAMVDRAFGEVYFAMSREAVDLKQELALLHKSLDYFNRAFIGALQYCMVPGVGDDQFREYSRNLLMQMAPVQMKPLSLTFVDLCSGSSDEELLVSIQNFLEECTSKSVDVRKCITSMEDVLLVVIATEKIDSKEKGKRKQKKMEKGNQSKVQTQPKSHTQVQTENQIQTESVPVSIDQTMIDEGCTSLEELDWTMFPEKEEHPFIMVSKKKKEESNMQRKEKKREQFKSVFVQNEKEKKQTAVSAFVPPPAPPASASGIEKQILTPDDEREILHLEIDCFNDSAETSTLSTSTVSSPSPSLTTLENVPFPDFYDNITPSSFAKVDEDIDEFCSASQKVFDKNWIVFVKFRESFVYNFMEMGLDLICYGSLQTNLTNMSSDVDVIVINSIGHDCSRGEVDLVLSWLQASFNDVEIRSCSSSPNGISLAVFFVDGVSFDMSFMTQSHQGVARTSLMTSEIQYRGLIGVHISRVTKVLKEILYLKGWNKPHTGGISGYILFYLVLFCADTYCSTFGATPKTSATLLQFFLYYYGCIWENEPLVLLYRIKPVKFPHVRDDVSFSSSEDILWVSDPLQPHKNIASRCTSFREIFTFFGRAYRNILGLLDEENVFEKLLTS